jgi:hypothetical protein
LEQREQLSSNCRIIAELGCESKPSWWNLSRNTLALVVMIALRLVDFFHLMVGQFA